MTLALEVTERRFIQSVLRAADSRSDAAVVLVGSHARGTSMTSLSDIDIVTVGMTPPRPAPPRIQLIALSEDDLRSRMDSGDDFVQWTLRLGSPLAGRAYWRKLGEELLAHAVWPHYERKLQHAATRISLARDLLAMGDLAATLEELRFALSHLARALLLRRDIFPLSRAELPDQLRSAGDGHLADAVEASGDERSLSDTRLSELLQVATEHLSQLSIP